MSDSSDQCERHGSDGDEVTNMVTDGEQVVNNGRDDE